MPGSICLLLHRDQLQEVSRDNVHEQQFPQKPRCWTWLAFGGMLLPKNLFFHLLHNSSQSNVLPRNLWAGSAFTAFRGPTHCWLRVMMMVVEARGQWKMRCSRCNVGKKQKVKQVFFPYLPLPTVSQFPVSLEIQTSIAQESSLLLFLTQQLISRKCRFFSWCAGFVGGNALLLRNASLSSSSRQISEEPLSFDINTFCFLTQYQFIYWRWSNVFHCIGGLWWLNVSLKGIVHNFFIFGQISYFE